jgi:hypothetical protein
MTPGKVENLEIDLVHVHPGAKKKPARQNAAPGHRHPYREKKKNHITKLLKNANQEIISTSS